ncbi:glycosyltransferase family 4 protein [Nakamurella deserti]|uniref:glycosyltransferase family 4 protein n=1 Tax=Nakamurella deserti TaxID=2164074 RepID=UPI000DBE7114|nr:glycosyltransferase [Nakamurella deserti]
MSGEIDRRGTLAFVPARFGDEVIGGAEIVLKQMALGLQARGWTVEILTTAALDHHHWENVFPTGTSEEGGLTVRRFPTVNEPIAERGELEGRIMRGEPVTLSEQQRWMNAGMRVPELYDYILDNKYAYRGLVFTPYPFWVTFACSQIAPERSVLWTCLHDEPYAYLDLFQPVFTGSAGLFFQTDPEYDLARRICSNLAPNAIVGCGVEVPEVYDPHGFRARYDIDSPFLLYAGRREGGKNWEQMLEWFAAAYERAPFDLKLVTMGSGDVNPPESIRHLVIDVGFLPDHERDNAFAAAAGYVQSSIYEAFSRTIMEAWLAGTPVIANAGSDVVSWHCERSDAGLTYRDAAEFEQCLRFLADDPAGAAALGARGRDYVLAHYRWETVLDAVEAKLVEWLPAPADVPEPTPVGGHPAVVDPADPAAVTETAGV